MKYTHITHTERKMGDFRALCNEWFRGLGALRITIFLCLLHSPRRPFVGPRGIYGESLALCWVPRQLATIGFFFRTNIALSGQP